MQLNLKLQQKWELFSDGTVRLQLGLFPRNRWFYLNEANSASWWIRLRPKNMVLLGMVNAAGGKAEKFSIK